jgi:hypothetical protein
MLDFGWAGRSLQAHLAVKPKGKTTQGPRPSKVTAPACQPVSDRVFKHSQTTHTSGTFPPWFPASPGAGEPLRAQGAFAWANLRGLPQSPAAPTTTRPCRFQKLAAQRPAEFRGLCRRVVIRNWAILLCTSARLLNTPIHIPRHRLCLETLRIRGEDMRHRIELSRNGDR